MIGSFGSTYVVEKKSNLPPFSCACFSPEADIKANLEQKEISLIFPNIKGKVA
jgi:hypothetical protein